MSVMPRVQAVVLPLLREALPGVKVGTWVENIDYRSFPMINIRRVGGTRYGLGPTQLGLPVIEMSAYRTEGLVETEQLYEDALEALYAAVRNQTATAAGYVHSITETVGATQLPALFADSWRIQGLIRLGIRPPRP